MTDWIGDGGGVTSNPVIFFLCCHSCRISLTETQTWSVARLWWTEKVFVHVHWDPNGIDRRKILIF